MLRFAQTHALWLNFYNLPSLGIFIQIAKVLKISEDEVEDWVVKAISAKLMDAKMDQLGQVVIIK